MNNLNEDEKNLIADLLRTPGWQILTKKNQERVDDYRKMATQQPESIPQDMRTWYSGKAEGREELILDIVDSIKLQ